MAVIFYYDFSSAIVEPPTSSQVRLDVAPPYNAASRVWVRNLTSDGLDAFYGLQAIDVGSTIVIQDKNEHARSVRFRVVGAAVEKADYFEIPVSWLDTGTLPLANNQAIAFGLYEPAAPTPEPPEPTVPLFFDHVVITAPLIPLAEAKAQLRITDADHDDEVSRTVIDAQNVILDYLKKGADPAWTATTVPFPVLAAIKKMLTHLYENRGDDMKKATATTSDSGAAVWDDVDRLLARFRDPALA